MVVFQMIHSGEPLTKSNTLQTSFRGKRGKKGKGKVSRFVYIPKRIKDYEKSLKEHAIQVVQNKRPTTKLLRMTVHYYLGTKRRKDLQNLDKSLCDAFNGVVYKDDNQIHEMHEYKHLDRANPRVEVLIETIENPSWENDKADDDSE